MAEVTDALRDRDCIYQSPGVREGAAEAAWTRIAMRELQRATEVWRHLLARAPQIGEARPGYTVYCKPWLMRISDSTRIGGRCRS